MNVYIDLAWDICGLLMIIKSLTFCSFSMCRYNEFCRSIFRWVKMIEIDFTTLERLPIGCTNILAFAELCDWLE